MSATTLSNAVVVAKPTLRPRLVSSERFCRSCGRALIETTEPELFSSETGRREYRVWVSCPRYFMSFWRNLLTLGTGGMGHTSFAKDNPLLAREWR